MLQVVVSQVTVPLKTCYLHSLNALKRINELLILFLSEFEVILPGYLDGIFQIYFLGVALKIVYLPDKRAKDSKIDLLDTVIYVLTDLDEVLWSQINHKILIVYGQNDRLFIYPAKFTSCFQRIFHRNVDEILQTCMILLLLVLDYLLCRNFCLLSFQFKVTAWLFLITLFNMKLFFTWLHFLK